ncbi:unnamed protein product [Onchocerca ochengi]|uniref:LAM_G_DOMAIN domain-containing protein n=1 Tax=Onchocerca ochengi TaxID=42157 RepID=A0A182EJK6_ONCOC|nr:unnamed protein product [Onchocerca ochengi]
MGCNKIEHLCKNGGHCLVDWMAAKNAENIVSCNCARTSYYGEYCDEDNGAYFAGHSILVLKTAEIFEKVIFDWNEIGEQTLSFAFSTTKTTKPTKLAKPQTLATIYFTHNKIMQIILCKNGSINIGITSTDVSFVYTFPYNYNDGYRHYFHARFRTNKSLKVTIDSWKYDFPSDLTASLSLASAIRFSFGGSYIADISDMIRSDKKTVKYNFTGCLSNIDIDVNVARMRLKPILYLYKSEFEFADSVTIIGNKIQLGASILNTVTAPVWDSPFVTESFRRSKNCDAKDIEGIEKTEWWIIPFLIALILLIILVTGFFLCKRKQRQQQWTPPKDPEKNVSSKSPENSPLLTGSDNEKRSLIVENDFALPEPDQQLDTTLLNQNANDFQSTESQDTSLTPKTVITLQPEAKSRVSSISDVSGMTAYFTANTEFDIDIDCENLLHDPKVNDDDNTDNDDCLDDTLSNYTENDNYLSLNRENL